MNIVEPIRRQAMVQPDAPAIACGEQQLTYRELIRQVGGMAGALLAEGVQRKDRVGLDVRDPHVHLICTLAFAHLGAVSVGLAAGRDSVARNGEIARAWQLPFVVHDRGAADSSLYAGLTGLLDVRDLAQAVGPVSVQATLAPSHPFRIAFSSGTTGEPKGILFSHGGALLKSELMGSTFRIGTADRMLVLMGIGQPFAMNYALRALQFGAAVVLAPDYGAGEMHRLIRESGATQLVTTPSFAIHLLAECADAGSAAAMPPATLARVYIGGGAMSQSVLQGLRRHLCAHVFVNYGASECGLVAVADASMQVEQPTCAGRLVPWVEAQALDAGGHPLAWGQTGTLRFRSPALAVDYVCAPGTPVPAIAAFRNGWFQSSDMGCITEDGRVFLSGRADHVLNIGGNKVDAERLEAVMHQDPAIVECVAVMIDDETGRPVLAAAVVATPELDERALRRRCAQALGRRYVPRLIVRMDSLPRNEGGKVRRKMVRQMLQDAVARPPLH